MNSVSALSEDSYRRKIVSLLFAFLLVKSLLFALLIPPWMGNDEPNHFEYVLSFAGENEAVQKTIIDSLNRTKFWERADMRPPHDGVSRFMNTELRFHSEDIKGTRPFLYYWTASLPLKVLPVESITVKLLFSRLVSVAFSMLTLWFIYLSARIVFDGERQTALSCLAVTVTGFHPQFSYLTAVVNSDAMMIFFFTLVFYFFAARIKEGAITLENLISLLLIIGLAFLVKKHAVILLVVAVAGIAFVFRPAKGRVKETLKAYLALIAFLACAVLLMEYFATVSMVKLIDRVGLSFAYSFSSPEDFKAVTFAGWLKGLAIMFVTFWFTYGQMVYKLSFGFYAMYALFSAAVVYGIIKGLSADVMAKSEAATSMPMPMPRFIFFSLIFAAAVIAANIFTFFSPELIHRVSGRYIFYASAPLSVLTVYGLGGAFSRVDAVNVEKAVALGFIAMNVITVFGYLIPIYHV